MPHQAIARNMRVFLSCLERLQSMDPEMPIQRAMALIHVALRPGMSVSDLAGEMKMSQSTASRNVGAWGRINRHHEQGHDMIEMKESPADRRVKNLALTPSGQRLIASLSACFA